MAFDLPSHALIDSETLSRFVFGVDDATEDLTGQNILSDAQTANVIFGVDAISRQIMRHVSSDIKQATYTEVWDGAASDELVPTERPITALSSLRFAANGDFSAAQEVTSITGAALFDKYVIKLRGFRLPTGRGAIRAVYTAGYDPVPADIAMALALQFQFIWRKMGSKTGDGMLGLKSISKAVGAATESQVKDETIKASGLISEVIGLLQGYQRFEAPHSIMFSRVS